MAKKFMGLAAGAIEMAASAMLHAESPQPDFAIVAVENIVWTPIPDGLGAAFAVIHGDPSKPGTYVVRVRFPAGVMDLPHSHSGDRHVTVLEGVWHAGTGQNFAPERAAPLGPGAYMFHPAGGVHWDGAKGDVDAVAQIIGEGPVETFQAHEESADWVMVK